jgi:hypothetical protein
MKHIASHIVAMDVVKNMPSTQGHLDVARLLLDKGALPWCKVRNAMALSKKAPKFW